MKSIAGIGVFLAVLFLWRMTFAYTCLAWLFPAIAFAAIFHGQYEYALHQKVFRARYFFKPESWIHRLLLGKVIAFISSTIIALAITFALIVFAALGSPSDWGFLIADAVLILGLYGFLARYIARHATDKVSGAVAKRLTVLISFWILLVPYIVISYNYISVPAYVDIASYDHTIRAASTKVASLCPASNWSMKLMQETQAAAWYGLVRSTPMLGGSYWGQLIWAGFFLNAALVFLAMGRGCVEMAAFINNKWQKNEQN